jgi:predicted RNase H-like HicB family nuclease
MILMTVGNSEGSRHCNARCYDAKGKHCTCCCSGKNHGKGLQAAIENTKNMIAEWSEAEGERVAFAAIQQELFAGAGA